MRFETIRRCIAVFKISYLNTRLSFFGKEVVFFISILSVKVNWQMQLLLKDEQSTYIYFKFFKINKPQQENFIN